LRPISRTGPVQRSTSVHLPPFQQLIDGHAVELHRFLAASVGPIEADDCLQETFLSALRAYPRLRDASNLRAWLYTIAHRKATDAVRRQRRHLVDPLDGGGPQASRADGDPRAVSSDGRFVIPDEGLWGAVRNLPSKQRTAVIHRFVFDLAYRDIAERMGGTEEAARQNVRAALQRLRAEVPDERTR
jgi:RNA polymerase sigma factor (sigma-70 family)